MSGLSFQVLDFNTLEEVNLVEVAEEPWLQNSDLMLCDLGSFFIDEDGRLLLSDDCGNSVYVPQRGIYIIRMFWGDNQYKDFEY